MRSQLTSELIKVEEQTFTTQAAINLELNTIRLMQQGRGKVEPLAFSESWVSDSHPYPRATTSYPYSPAPPPISSLPGKALRVPVKPMP